MLLRDNKKQNNPISINIVIKRNVRHDSGGNNLIYIPNMIAVFKVKIVKNCTNFDHIVMKIIFLIVFPVLRQPKKSIRCI